MVLLPVEFSCPACGAPVHTDPEDLSPNRDVVCPGCGSVIAVAEGQPPSIVEPSEPS